MLSFPLACPPFFWRVGNHNMNDSGQVYPPMATPKFTRLRRGFTCLSQRQRPVASSATGETGPEASDQGRPGSK